MTANRRILAFALAMAVLAGCSEHSATAGRDVKAPATRAAGLETWTKAGSGRGSRVHVTITSPEGSKPCTMLKVRTTAYAALWPARAIRQDDGVRLDGHLYRFGDDVELRGRKYEGGRTTTFCVATDLWMVLGGS